MHRLVTILILAMLLTALAIPALAKTKRSFETMDTDRDGWISFEEVFIVHPGVDEEHFDKFDMDKDGVLNEQEWKRFTPR